MFVPKTLATMAVRDRGQGEPPPDMAQLIAPKPNPVYRSAPLESKTLLSMITSLVPLEDEFGPSSCAIAGADVPGIKSFSGRAELHHIGTKFPPKSFKPTSCLWSEVNSSRTATIV